MKPENILLDKEGHVRLCDFGFATTVEPSATGGSATPLQDGCGTVMYMAPELAGKTPGLSHGFPVDWWALGCVLFELVTGMLFSMMCVIFYVGCVCCVVICDEMFVACLEMWKA